jgi:hypothetical protein
MLLRRPGRTQDRILPERVSEIRNSKTDSLKGKLPHFLQNVLVQFLPNNKRPKFKGSVLSAGNVTGNSISLLFAFFYSTGWICDLCRRSFVFQYILFRLLHVGRPFYEFGILTFSIHIPATFPLPSRILASSKRILSCSLPVSLLTVKQSTFSFLKNSLPWLLSCSVFYSLIYKVCLRFVAVVTINITH